MSDQIQAFRIEIPEEQLTDLKTRLEATRFPEAETVDDWTQGVPLAYLKEVCHTWAFDYDWRKTERRLNEIPQFKIPIDGLGIHFLHIESPHPGAIPLLLTHGWPGSVIEFLDVLGPLSDPPRYGGDAADAFHVICPSLPGYGFSEKPTTTGWSVERTAKAWGVLMQRLGYDRFFAQGGDWGAAVTTAIGIQNTEHCIGLHLNMPTVGPDPATLGDLTPAEEEAIRAGKYYRDWDSGYSKQQSTRPQTVGYGLVDSPAAQAAWILEKFWAWTDGRGADVTYHPENALTREQLLDNIMLYWLPATGASSARLYWESFAKTARDKVLVPAGCSIFPREIFKASRRWVEKRFKNLVYWNELERGGHFAAFEQPETLVKEIRDCFRLMR